MGKYKVMQIKQDLQGQSDSCASQSLAVTAASWVNVPLLVLADRV